MAPHSEAWGPREKFPELFVKDFYQVLKLVIFKLSLCSKLENMSARLLNLDFFLQIGRFQIYGRKQFAAMGGKNVIHVVVYLSKVAV